MYLMNSDVYSNLWYFFPPQLFLPDCIAYWLTFFVFFSNLMPISPYPTMEICNAAQPHFIRNEVGGAEAESAGNADDVEKTCRGLPDGEARLAAHRTRVSRSLGASPRRLVSCGSR